MITLAKACDSKRWIIVFFFLLVFYLQIAVLDGFAPSSLRASFSGRPRRQLCFIVRFPRTANTHKVGCKRNDSILDGDNGVDLTVRYATRKNHHHHGAPKSNSGPRQSTILSQKQSPFEIIKRKDRRHKQKRGGKRKSGEEKQSLKFKLQQCLTPQDVLDQVVLHQDFAFHSSSSHDNILSDPTLASLVLVRLSKLLISMDNVRKSTPAAGRTLSLPPISTKSTKTAEETSQELQRLVHCKEAWQRLAHATAKSFQQQQENQSMLQYCVDALKSLAVIARILPQVLILSEISNATTFDHENIMKENDEDPNLIWHDFLQQVQNRNDDEQTTDKNMAAIWQPHLITGAKWAMDSLSFVVDETIIHHDERIYKKLKKMTTMPTWLEKQYLNLGVPFRIRPGCLIKENVATCNDFSIVDTLEQQVSFQKDIVQTTTTDRAVSERRFTAWQGDDDETDDDLQVCLPRPPPPFAYSGKSMPTQAWSPLVKKIRNVIFRETGEYYNGCLLNYYPHGESGMRYHSDPDQGDIWDFSTSVVSLGATRRFAFRTIPVQPNQPEQPHVFTLFQGDVTEMFGNCQARYQHTVRMAEDRREQVPRASLVFKRSLLSK